MNGRFKKMCPKVYVVSLPTDIRRRAHTEDILKPYAIEPEFIDGVIVEDIGEDMFKHPGFYKDIGDATEEEVLTYRKRICGVTQAHLHALKKGIENAEEENSLIFLILEDDIELCEDFDEAVINLYDKLESDNRNWIACNLQVRMYSSMAGKNKKDQIANDTYYKGTTWGHQGYMYNCRELPRLKDFYHVLKYGCQEEIDNFYTRLVNHFNLYGSIIPIVAQKDDFVSNISTRNDYINNI
jgi:GR25 family glycosyltransferase involved in LPS biosynthesis